MSFLQGFVTGFSRSADTAIKSYLESDNQLKNRLAEKRIARGETEEARFKKEFREYNNDDLHRSVQTMAISFSEIINLCIEDFKKSNCGRIIVISSFVNKSIGLNNKIFPITAAAKGALEALTKTLSFQLARDNVTVNAISPGYTKKDGNHSALSQDEWDNIINKIPLSRLARPEDIANLVNFLLSNEASYITGQVIKVDGGLSLL